MRALLSPDSLCAQNADLPNLLEPHRMVPLEGVNIVFIAAGAAACHRFARSRGLCARFWLALTAAPARSVAIDDAGRVYTWGRNDVRAPLRRRGAPKRLAGRSS